MLNELEETNWFCSSWQDVFHNSNTFTATILMHLFVSQGEYNFQVASSEGNQRLIPGHALAISQSDVQSLLLGVQSSKERSAKLAATRAFPLFPHCFELEHIHLLLSPHHHNAASMALHKHSLLLRPMRKYCECSPPVNQRSP